MHSSQVDGLGHQDQFIDYLGLLV